MRIDGEWYPCDDGVVRPIIRGAVMNAYGFWEPALFLVDIGADRTVFSAAILELLGFPPIATAKDLGGVGGVAKSVIIKTQVRLDCDDGGKAVFRGEYAAFVDLEALDISVLGRDIMDRFAVIVDRPNDVICLLGQRHHYIIVGS